MLTLYIHVYVCVYVERVYASYMCVCACVRALMHSYETQGDA
jgi:hypothetical protein